MSELRKLSSDIAILSKPLVHELNIRLILPTEIIEIHKNINHHDTRNRGRFTKVENNQNL